ncbi:MAG: DegT/DnrJ/EryC1/StrS family aminotransferase [Gemmataceae bacterium]
MSASNPAGVPLFDLHVQYSELQPQIEAALARVLASGQVILGPEVAALEEEVAAYCGASHGVGCGSGTEALSLALHGLEIGEGDEVILPAFTFFATAGCIARCGARPVFADIDPVSFNIDPDQVEAMITPRTRAIMVVHLFGQCADMSRLWRIAERHNLAIIEDAAQSMGAEYENKRAGSLGVVGCLSFYPTKNLGAYGDAGMTVTSDPALAARMNCLRVHGMEPRYYHKYMGWNARIDALQACMLRVKLPHLDRWISNRQAAAARYDELIDRYHLASYLQRPVAQDNRRHTYNQYVVRVGRGDRDALVQHLKAEKIGCEIYYPLSLHLQECLRYLGYGPGDFPVSEAASRCVIALPIFPEITAAQQERVLQGISAYVHRLARKAS